MEIKNKDLKTRIIEISYKHKLSHLGSCLTAVDIIKEIIYTKRPKEKFVLSCGHAGLALYVTWESTCCVGFDNGLDEELLDKCGIHPHRSEETKPFVDCSTGSLGQGLPIAVGMALSDRTKNVYCLISDGECGEGSIWESLRIIEEQKLTNLKLYVNINGYGAYKEIPKFDLMNRIKMTGITTSQTNFRVTNVDYLPFLQGLTGHYHVMNEEDYKLAMEVLK